MHSHFLGVVRYMVDLEEKGSAILYTEAIKILDFIRANDGNPEDGGNAVIGEGTKSRLGYLGIKACIAFYINALAVVFKNDFEIIKASILANVNSLFCLVQVKRGNS